MIYYCGIGSRITPIDILSLMTLFAETAAIKNLVLRSGGAPGADFAFEHGCDKNSGTKEIFLPWKMFNKNRSPFYQISPEAYEIAAQVHPAWKYLVSYARTLIARNMHQVLGSDLKTPAKFIIAWTKDGAETEKQCSKDTGGTGSAIILASRLLIPVFNIKNETRLDAAYDFINQSC